MNGPRIAVVLESNFFGVAAKRDGFRPVRLGTFEPSEEANLEQCRQDANRWARSIAAVLSVGIEEFPARLQKRITKE